MASSDVKSDICIVVLMGLPGAGKTTFSQQFVSKFSQLNYNVIHICYDVFVDLNEQARFALEAIESEDDASKWKEKRKEISDSVEKFLEIVTPSESVEAMTTSTEESSTSAKFSEQILQKFREFSAPKDPLILLIDDNFYYSSMRYQFFQIARKFEIGFCQFWLDVHTDEAVQRNQSRRREDQVPDEVIKKMAGKFEPPNPMTNPWERFSFSLKFDQESFPVEMCRTVIDLARTNPVLPVPDRVSEEERDKSRAACTASVVHQADKLLRKKLNTTILDAKRNQEKFQDDKVAMQEYCKQLNGVRNEILEDLKTGFVKLPVEVIKAVESKTSGAVDNLDVLVTQMFDLKLSQA